MNSLRDLEIFVLCADLGSLSAAARQLDLTPAAASAAVKRIEAQLAVALFVRSTRSQRLTPEGELFLGHCRQALEALEDGRAALGRGRAAVQGTLRLSMPSDLGRNRVLDWLDEFQNQHPRLGLRVLVSDRIADIYRLPVDLALRYGEPPDSSLISLPIAPRNRRVLCAAPDYLRRAGHPTSPDQLADHNCLCFRLGEQLHDRWHFQRGGREQTVSVHGDRNSDDGDIVRRWAASGRGIAYKSRLDVAPDLAAGRLVELCAEWQGEAAPVNLICADRRLLSPAVRALHAFLVARCAG